MNLIKRKTRSIREQIEYENALAEIAKNKANTDYIAMMTDVDIPTEDDKKEEKDNGTQPEI